MSASTSPRRRIDPSQVTVVIFAALTSEATAVLLSFDEELQCVQNGSYVFQFGCIGKHNIVLAQLNDMGKVNASNISAYVTHEFRNIRLALMAGIGGGIPHFGNDVRLGDVAVSKPVSNLPGVLQYDLAKREEGGRIIPKGTLDKPHSTLRSAVNSLERDEMLERCQLDESLAFIVRKNSRFGHPKLNDVLYDITFSHLEPGNDCAACEMSSRKKTVDRPRRQNGPKVHRGLIMSGDSVVKDAYERLRLCQGYEDALCFEMEAAGIMDEHRCLVIRGICDYCDTHKQDGWHEYAAAVAAAYARTILLSIPGDERASESSGKYKDILPVQHDAFYDSDFAGKAAPLCHEEDTRRRIRGEIARWLADVHGETIFWLHGPAGTGKSTICRSIAHQLATNGEAEVSVRLGASFFFKAPSSKQFFPTIASSLLRSIPQFEGHLYNSLENCGWVSKAEVEGKDRTHQFEKLILDPLTKLPTMGLGRYLWVIAIDGLDECEKEHIPNICTQLSRLQGVAAGRLRVFLTSRSTSMIHDVFEDLKAKHVVRSLSLLSFPNETRIDIQKILNTRFAEIKKKRRTPNDWPNGNDLERLLTLATTPSPLFIYAETVCRFVHNAFASTNPVDRLQIWLEQAKNATQLDDQFNNMYERVLDQAFSNLYQDEKEKLATILRSIALLVMPLPATALATLLNMCPFDVQNLLPNLHAVLDVPDDGPVLILHESFRDFLLYSESKAVFFVSVDASKDHERLALRCIDRMEGNSDEDITGLRKGLCRREGYDPLFEGILATTTTNKAIALDLEYACLNWVQHVQGVHRATEHIKDTSRTSELQQRISALLQIAEIWLGKHFLHWIEALALLGRLSDGIASIKLLRLMLQSMSDSHSYFSTFLEDADRFTTTFGSVITRFPLQVYGAALTFCPADSQVYKRLGGERHPNIPVLKNKREGWGQYLHTLKAHGGSVNAVAFSSNHTLLASASSDRTVKLWDCAAGSHKRTLQGHGGYVLSVAFSPDSVILASGSSDRTVRLWGVDEGNHWKTLDGHGGWVNSVVFASNSVVVSASSDRTIRLWAIRDGTLLATLEDHDSGINAIAFSANRTILASVSGSGNELDSPSGGGTVKLWDMGSHKSIRTLSYDSGAVNAVAFSPDDCTIAAAVTDSTIQLWDVRTGTHLRTLSGHSDSVNAVAFLSSTILASASSDKTIGIWNLATDTAQKLEGSDGWLTDITVSPDQNVLAAASNDGTVRTWDSAINTACEARQGHNSPVDVVARSPNGKWLASASNDGEIWIWQLNNNTHVKTLRCRNHRTGYMQVIAFSPDGTMLASGSTDGTLVLWSIDLATEIRTLGNSHDGIRYGRIPDDIISLTLAIAFSPDGRMVAAGSSDWSVKLYSVNEEASATVLKGHSSSVRAVAFSLDGRLLVSASTDGMLWLWRVDRGSEELASGHLRVRHSRFNSTVSGEDWVRHIAFSPDGTRLALALTDGTVSRLDLDRVTDANIPDFLAIALSLDGTIIETIRRSEPVTGDERPRLTMTGRPQERLPSCATPDQLWKIIEAGISQILVSPDSLSMETYMPIYTSIHSFCTGKKMTARGLEYDLSHSRYLGNDLYTRLRDSLINHLEQLVRNVKTYRGQALLGFYTREWLRFFTAAKVINGCFRYMNRHWIASERRRDVYDIFTLHLVLWRRIVLEATASNVIEVVLKLVEMEREGEIIESGQIKETMEAFTSLSSYSPQLREIPDVYQQFERRFLEATKLFYVAESRQGLASHGVVEYMKRAEMRLNQEVELGRNYFHPDTGILLRKTCITTLIADHAAVLRGDFERLLEEGREEDMARMVSLLAHLPDCLSPLLFKFEGRLRKAGLAAVMRATSSTKQLRPKIYVGAVATDYEALSRFSDGIAGAKDSSKPIFISEEWMGEGGTNIVHLPPDYRATCALVCNGVLVLGHRSGRVSFFQLPER